MLFLACSRTHGDPIFLAALKDLSIPGKHLLSTSGNLTQIKLNHYKARRFLSLAELQDLE
jgi:hypothetical protein